MVDGNDVLFSGIGEAADYMGSMFSAHDLHEDMAFQASSMSDAIYNSSNAQRSELQFQSNLNRMLSLNSGYRYRDYINYNDREPKLDFDREEHRTCEVIKSNGWLRVVGVVLLALIVVPIILCSIAEVRRCM